MSKEELRAKMTEAQEEYTRLYALYNAELDREAKLEEEQAGEELASDFMRAISAIVEHWLNLIIHDLGHIAEYILDEKDVSEDISNGVHITNALVNTYLASLYGWFRSEPLNGIPTTKWGDINEWTNKRFGEYRYKSMAEILEEDIK